MAGLALLPMVVVCPGCGLEARHSAGIRLNSLTSQSVPAEQSLRFSRSKAQRKVGSTHRLQAKCAVKVFGQDSSGARKPIAKEFCCITITTTHMRI